MRVLCLDIEGGYGGSSRSLFESVRHLHGDVDVEVWCRQEGPIQPRYAALGVPCSVVPSMPHISSLPRLSRNIYAFGRFALNWPGSGTFREGLASAVQTRFDVVHFNHDGLFLLLRWLRLRLGLEIPMTMHIRTHLPSTLFSRWQYRTIVEGADRLAFITENERERTALLARRPVVGEVINNIVSAPDASVAPDLGLVRESRFKVAVLSNYAWIRGVDRMIDVACALAECGRRDTLFVMAGRMDLPRSLPGSLGRVARRGGDLADYARERDVADMFRFVGHVSDPQPILAACDLLAKPTREHNPWGRDILEGMAFARAPITIGSYDRFVENGVTGVLHEEFDAGAWAEEIIRLADNRAECVRLGAAARTRVLKLCDGPARARDLVDLWKSAGGS